VASDAVGPDAQVVSALTVRALWAHGLGALDDRERYVLCRRFGLDGEPEERLADLGVTLNLSREAVRQIEAKALAKMQHPLVLKKISRHDDAAPRTSARLRSPGERMHRVLESVG
jgi:DNA-directed RNA polymerase sigma subunit (sigma70/sigma32)